MERAAIFQYVEDQYGIQPEYLWSKYPSYAVLRQPQNHKWFAILMDVSADKLGLLTKQSVPIMVIKLEPETVESLQADPAFLPAYHMNKIHWVSARLDKIGAKESYQLLERSYTLISG